jgi:formylglycine-generating enzyme required for sulfatase activity
LNNSEAKGCRLPIDAEWEWVARDGKNRKNTLTLGALVWVAQRNSRGAPATKKGPFACGYEPEADGLKNSSFYSKGSCGAAVNLIVPSAS